MRKTRVLLLLHELSRTGAPRSALDGFEAMRDDFEVRTVVPAGGPLEEDCRAIGRLDILSEVFPRNHSWRHIFGRFRWKRWIRELSHWGPDAIYINSVASLPILWMAPLRDVPAILHVRELHSHLLPLMRECPDLLTVRPTRYLAVSDAVRRALVTECGIAPDRIAVVHVFIPERRLDAVIHNRSGRPNNGALVVGGCGGPGWRKGTTLWLQMAAEVRRLVGPSARFIWVGVNEEQEGVMFRREVHLMGLDDVVELIPLTPRALEYFAGFDIFAMTSWEDPCPRVVLENMGLGTPVVCFAGGGGSPEVLADTGVIIPDFDPLAMARAVAELAASPQERARLGDLARQRMRDNFTDRVQVPKIRHELRRLIGR